MYFARVGKSLKSKSWATFATFCDYYTFSKFETFRLKALIPFLEGLNFYDNENAIVLGFHICVIHNIIDILTFFTFRPFYLSEDLAFYELVHTYRTAFP